MPGTDASSNGNRTCRNHPSGDPATLTSAGLLDRCSQGDPVAWEYLLGRYERLVYAIARREGLSDADSADVAQTVFWHLLRSLGSIKEPDRLAYWLTTVTRREAWQLRTRIGREQPTDTPDAGVTDSAWEQAIWVHEAVQRLGEPCRTMIDALFFAPHQWTHDELAERLGRTPAGLGSLRAVCLRRLRRLLQP